MITGDRLYLLKQWLNQLLNTTSYQLKPLQNDASFRRYFRLYHEQETYVVMDAPPDKQNSKPFVAIAVTLEKLGVIVPEIFAKELDQGFLLLSDLGPHLLFDTLKSLNPNLLYQQAIETLLKVQACQKVPGWQLPCFNPTHINEELKLFRIWFLQGLLKLPLTANENTLLLTTYATITERIHQQPYLFIHRDYHSRNLIVLENQQIGVLDFQDAMHGPLTYDVVSLLRDCYIHWPRKQVQAWALSYWRQALQANRIPKCTPEQFLSWFDWMGIQRHLKAIGIFARLNLRDHKPGYLKDIPRTLAYVLETAKIYPELQKFGQLIQEKILPKLARIFYE